MNSVTKFLNTVFGSSREDDNGNFLLTTILRGIRIIMANQEETLAAMAALKDQLDATNARVVKVGTEIDGLVQAVADLTAAAGNVQTTPEFDAAFAAVKDSADSLAAVVAADDDKVADAAPSA